MTKIENKDVSSHKICFVIAYFGKFPVWFPAFLISCRFNNDIDWLIFTDIEDLPFHKPVNVNFKKMTLGDFKLLAEDKLAAKIQFKIPHKLCDFKPMYGHLFQADLKNYDYWGHCDLDLIWGDIGFFLRRINFDQYDIISTREMTICGHFTLYKNTPSINILFKQVVGFEKLLVQENYSGFDEGFFSFHLYEESLKSNFKYKIYWPKKHAVDWPELSIKPHGWYWLNGKIYDKNGIEREYLHFMKWKGTVKSIDFDLSDSPKKFLITQHGIWANPMNFKSKVQYWFSDHYGRMVMHYCKKIVNRILKRSEPKGPLIPEEYKIIK